MKDVIGVMRYIVVSGLCEIRRLAIFVKADSPAA